MSADDDAPGDGVGLADGDGLADGAALNDGEARADGPAEGIATDGDGDATTGLAVAGTRVGGGVGRSPTGSGPTNTNAARIPSATRMPARSPARIVMPVFIAGRGYQYGRAGA